MMLDHSQMVPSSLVLAEAFTLVSWWKALLILVPMIPWAWLVSTVFDKHAARWYLPRQMHGNIHLIVGIVAFFTALLLPVQSDLAFLLSLLVMIVILGSHVLIYMAVVNKSDQVPEAHKLRFDPSKLRGEKKASKEKTGKSELVIKSPDKQVVPVPAAETPESALRLAAEQLVVNAMNSRASRVELAPASKEQHAAALTIDGVKTQGQTYPAADGAKLIDFWKSAAKLDLAERRKRLQGDIVIERGVDKKKLRIVTSGGQSGQRMVIQFDPDSAVRRSFEQLGLVDAQGDEMKSLVTEGRGIVLIATPQGQGRTTTFYAVMKLHDAYTQNVQTIESDIQDAIEGVKQNKFEPGTEGAEHATLTRSILRRDPDVVGVADMTDEPTAKEIARADLERSRVYVGVRADSALQAVQVWVKAVGDPEQALKHLQGVVSNKVLRKICMNCRVAYPPTPDMLKKLGLPADKVSQFFKKGGQVLVKNKPEVCPACQGSGYVGQEGVFEIYRFGQAERDLLKAGNLPAVKAEMRKRGSLSIQQAALRKAVEGVTSVEEVMRATADAPAAAPAPKAAAPAAKPTGA